MWLQSSSKWCNLSLKEASNALKTGQVSAVELTNHCIDRIKETRELNLVVHDTFELAHELAHQSDQRRKDGKSLGLLDGIPVGIKDNFCMKNIQTTASSKMLHSTFCLSKSTINNVFRFYSTVRIDTYIKFIKCRSDPSW